MRGSFNIFADNPLPRVESPKCCAIRQGQRNGLSLLRAFFVLLVLCYNWSRSLDALRVTEIVASGDEILNTRILGIRSSYQNRSHASLRISYWGASQSQSMSSR